MSIQDNNSSVVIGFGGSSHDFSSAIAVDFDLKYIIEEERLSRRKHGEAWWYQNPVKLSLNYCLKAAEKDIDEVDMFVSSDLLPERVISEFPKHKLQLFPHHLCHAASAVILAPKPSQRIGVIVYDGMGSSQPVEQQGMVGRETFSFYVYERGSFETIGQTKGLSHNESTDFPMGSSNSIGHLYELVTLALEFGPFQEGKTMGLASHGYPKFLPLLEEYTTLNNDPDNCFTCEPFKTDLADQIEQALTRENYSFAVKADMAASIQALQEKVLLHCWTFLEPYAPDCLVVVGGCGLNSVANGKLASHLPENMPLVIPPFTGDSGLGIGAIKLYELQCSKQSQQLTFRQQTISAKIARPGRSYSQREIYEAIRNCYPQVVVDKSVTGPQCLAKKIANGEIIAVFNGGSEFGPRALGGRSIIADPRRDDVRERINRLIKKREPFRPLAPIILQQHYAEFFADESQADPFMIKVADVLPEVVQLIPSVVHVDNTARVQVTNEQLDPFLTELLLALKDLTGIPIVLNTSFNRRGEPIVETPTDALDCMLSLELDGLWLQDCFVYGFES